MPPNKKTGEANLSGFGSRPVSRVLYPCGRLSFIQAAGYPAAQATYPGAIGRAGPLPYLVLLQTGFAWLAVSPRRPVGSYSTLSPLPVRHKAAWRSAFCCAFQRSLSLGVTQRFALRSPDFPLRIMAIGPDTRRQPVRLPKILFFCLPLKLCTPRTAEPAASDNITAASDRNRHERPDGTGRPPYASAASGAVLPVLPEKCSLQ